MLRQRALTEMDYDNRTETNRREKERKTQENQAGTSKKAEEIKMPY